MQDVDRQAMGGGGTRPFIKTTLKPLSHPLVRPLDLGRTGP
jgi:hypothetical protein